MGGYLKRDDWLLGMLLWKLLWKLLRELLRSDMLWSGVASMLLLLSRYLLLLHL